MTFWCDYLQTVFKVDADILYLGFNFLVSMKPKKGIFFVIEN